MYLSATYNLTYIASYALVTSLITHTILFHGPRIYRAIINVKTEPDDIHAKLMRRYPAVPIWWYTVALCLFGGVFAIVAVEVYDTGLPVWAYLVAILLASLYILPSAFIFAMTAQPIAINLIAQLIPGYVFPGQPIPCMVSSDRPFEHRALSIQNQESETSMMQFTNTVRSSSRCLRCRRCRSLRCSCRI